MKNQDTIPFPDELKSLLYIACTRAMHKLKLFYTGNPSPFLPEQDALRKVSLDNVNDR